MKIPALSKTTKISLVIVFFAVQTLVAADIFSKTETTVAQQEQANKYLGLWGLPMPQKLLTHDGCTLFPDKLPLHEFTATCLAHDIGYWAGGDAKRKEAVDKEFYANLGKSGPLGAYVFAPLMYTGVALFGDSFITDILGASWGYGSDT
jgi:hypothetical protein